mmetsp:Transcript_9486/g.23182  ORF Transcript_9486/g.23182 Transcript_9486/m.23182 type:complete len:84 (+) Transcript_9486:194-445(+)
MSSEGYDDPPSRTNSAAAPRPYPLHRKRTTAKNRNTVSSVGYCRNIPLVYDGTDNKTIMQRMVEIRGSPNERHGGRTLRSDRN